VGAGRHIGSRRELRWPLPPSWWYYYGVRRSTRLLISSILAACHSAPHAPRPLRLGTTYTVQQSGALAVLESLWTGAPLAVVVAPSGQVLQAGARGDLDLTITHAPSLEARLLGSDHALLRCPLVASRFAIVGPIADPAGAASAPTAAAAFRRIATARQVFVSRGDSSGTHVKELALWRASGTRPERPWYLESGADQATTLHLADERNGYALADLPTLAKLRDLRLRVLFAADTALTNPYTLHVVRTGEPHPAAAVFARWAMDTARERILALRLPDGTPGFARREGTCAPPATGGAPTSVGASRQDEFAGVWEYVAPAPKRERPAPGAGFSVAVAFDSTTGPFLFGHVARWWAGDVGLPAAQFGPVTGTIEASRVVFVIPFAVRTVPAITVRARRVAPDTLVIEATNRATTASPFAGPGAKFVRTGRVAK
jgi:tungstate transport system substrate-binding protein